MHYCRGYVFVEKGIFSFVMFELSSLVQDNNNFYTTVQQEEEDGKTFVCDKRDRLSLACFVVMYT